MSIKALAAFLKYDKAKQNEKKSSLLKFPGIYRQIKIASCKIRVIFLFLAAKSRYTELQTRRKTSAARAYSQFSNGLLQILQAAEWTNVKRNFRYFRKHTHTLVTSQPSEICFFPSSCPAANSSSPFTRMVTMGGTAVADKLLAHCFIQAAL